MAATADSLQQQVDEICACCPVLSPAIIPSGYETQDLVELMQNAGRESVQAFEELLEGAGRGVTCCCVCGADGTPSTSGGGSDDDSDGEGDASLYFTVLTGLSFKDRTVAMKRAGFACGQCRALRSTNRMIRFAALRVGADAPADDDDEEQGDSGSRLLALAAHLASVNRAPDSLQASPEGLAVWLQELYCRAHALQVVASNLGGWRCVGPTGQVLRLARPKDVVAAARALLQPPEEEAAQKPRKEGRKKQAAAGKQVVAAGQQAAAVAGKGAGKAAQAKQEPPKAAAGPQKGQAVAALKQQQQQQQAGAGKKRSAVEVAADQEAPRAAGKKAKGGAPPPQAKPAKPAAAAKAPVPQGGKAGKRVR
ncbi:hypothetical protein CHLRE_12g540450v5 [Chlamydomonas reinhardtii]|uniref:Uncharacterized protein n=1 Tax=Chlamydomonas reinhardtii TaxID=3055 RepID=A8IYU7_CHLRE|nr:uncharacterized protein CHLRE_12g540450v5 [Chlamydomonas reinhardtii]PNW76291.1 hypothetical protein CHLRE_12g540450v5 [Chlamydomonas reinhardtii]|eukprot:XP_001694060.1 predicted protein [Chlamydomonas reinhardtii]